MGSGLTSPIAEPLERALSIVTVHLLQEGWIVGRPQPGGLLQAQKGGRTVVFLLRVSLYPALPKMGDVDIPWARRVQRSGQETWFAMVQLTTNLEPMFTPEYVQYEPPRPR